MTNEEKTALVEGKHNWFTHAIPSQNLPSICLTDGPHGLRKAKEADSGLSLKGAEPSTCFPTAVTLANSFDTALATAEGEAIGQECRYYNVSVLLGPGCNIKRNPLCGRNFEYFSEDPILSGRMAGSLAKGVESQGVASCVKHFVCNNAENFRVASDSIVDERALNEIYLRSFKIALQVGNPSTLMCSYNAVNGTNMAENSALLSDKLRKEWNYHGVVMTDWGATHDRVASLKAGIDLEMPGAVVSNRNALLAALPEDPDLVKAIDKSVERISHLVRTVAPDGKNHPLNVNAHSRKALDVALGGAVLLKNEGHRLPLANASRLCVIGYPFVNMRYQGGGSSMINPLKTITPQESFDTHGITYDYAQGYDPFDSKKDACLREEALELAEKAENVLVFLELDDLSEMEGFDRTNLSLGENQLKLMTALDELDKPITVVLFGGAPVTLPFLKDIEALLYVGLPGEMGGEAIYRLLFGEVSPSGKLAQTWVNDYQAIPFSSEYSKGRQELYKEGIFVGYRYFLSHPEGVLFPFGFGLSYAAFEYSDLLVKTEGANLYITYKIKNIGAKTAKEVSQVYVAKKDSATYRPLRELKGFAKTELAPGEAKDVAVTIPLTYLAYYETSLHRMVLEDGRYEIMIGASSTDIRLTTALTLAGEKVTNPLVAKPYQDIDFSAFKKEDFLTIYAKPLPEEKKITDHPEELLISEYYGFWGRRLREAVHHYFKRAAKKAKKNPNPELRANGIKDAVFGEVCILHATTRFIMMSTSGQVNRNQAIGLAEICNRRMLKGMAIAFKKEKSVPFPDDERK
jgi:beta-glucosidase